MEPDVPLVVPEVNASQIKAFKKRGIIANPNCSTIQMVLALNPLHQAARIKRVVVATYQAVSGAGQKAVQELEEQTRGIFNFKEPTPKVFPHPIAFNCLPQIDVFLESGATKEEQKVVQETKKIMGDDTIEVSATCVRVPVFNCHAEAVNLEFEKDLSPEKARELLEKAPGVTVIDDPAARLYPLQTQASGEDEVFVGRIRRDTSVRHGLNLWVVSDNLRKGAALNAIQIAEHLHREGLLGK
jgi:aspartate-semialdehyde dehydrogenase